MFRYLLLGLIVCFTFSCKKDKTETKESNEVVTEEKIVTPSESASVKNAAAETITFPSKDGLLVTADVYKVNDKPVSILLCHQAGYSRGEYKDTAIRLNELGYSVMAIDQRSGKGAKNIVNETAKRAADKNLPTNYVDARQDIEAAIDYIYESNSNQPILVVGSSYSASLALLVGLDNDKVKAVAAFSPGEYFQEHNIQEEIKGYDKPVFVTSSKQETERLVTLVSLINAKHLVHYKPTSKGIHGSRALWNKTEGSEGYWTSFKSFLTTLN